MKQQELPQRKRPSSGVYISLSEPTIVWLTVCAKNREPWLACKEVHDSLVAAWRHADAWSVGRYIIMPDHLHLFCAPRDLDMPLKNWITYWKSRFSRAVKRENWKWQSAFWDTRLRLHDNYTEKWMYALNNPVRAGLVKNSEDWPYHGEVNKLRWRTPARREPRPPG